MIIMDLSGSFSNLMIEQGKAWEFTIHCIDEYFRQRIGNEADQVILCQISGERRSLLWEGHPLQLRQEFRGPGEFRDFLRKRANPNGSLVHDGIAHALKYMTSQDAVRSGNAKTVTMIFSDFLDNGPDPEESEKKLLNEFVTYHKMGGYFGFYYVDQDMYFKWKDNFDAEGIKLTMLPSINGYPPIPDFEQ